MANEFALLCKNKHAPLNLIMCLLLGDFQLSCHTSIRYLRVCLSGNDHRSKITAKATKVFTFRRHNLYGCTIPTSIVVWDVGWYSSYAPDG